ncbi:hypothetical protein O1L68_19935 [Streptomyces lydicus]|nr:hypothetical protein [Streptomyces lydicus]
MIDHPALRNISHAVPVRVTVDRTLRVKVIDACGMTCTFCHNEGTPVSADNHEDHAGEFGAAGRSGRVSIYLATNGARFITAPIFPDDTFHAALTQLRDVLDFNEVHLTGGEPTLHPAYLRSSTCPDRPATRSASHRTGRTAGASSLAVPRPAWTT